MIIGAFITLSSSKTDKPYSAHNESDICLNFARLVLLLLYFLPVLNETEFNMK